MWPWSEESSVAFKNSVKIVEEQVAALTNAKKTKFYNLCPKSESSMQEMERFNTNSIEDKNSVAVHLFLFLSLLPGICSKPRIQARDETRSQDRI